MNFQYYLPVNLIFGRGQISQVGIQTAKYGRKALIVTGRNSTKKSGLLDKTAALLKAAGVEAVIFDEVAQNPLTDTAYRGAAIAAENGCDVVVGLGGGSMMDAAKAIAFLSENSGDISDYIFGRNVSDRALPIVLVPTTCGTGSEGNGFAVLTNPETHDKKSLRCSAIVAKASIIDPELMTTMPKSVLASVGFDALCHNMEAYLSLIGQPMTDMMALEGIRLSGSYLKRVYDDSADLEAWESITWASTLGGMTINTAGVTAPHGLEHPASGLRDIVHGRGLAALTPVIIEESIKGAPEKFAVISRLLGGRDENDCALKVRELLAALDLTTTLGAQGIREEDVDWMAENCLKVSAAGIANHPVQFGLEDLKRIYRKAL
ncbi:Alcohol dehydrogenase, class IV [Sporobacter termitidis DSM 10068]|uniref:Alcohol dehydrogenase, class IV n=1 Tax=Sporobacter termitidis DSM 10068 TaxID=1123282 RepID=A0A1M5XES9_9FIRM|nr:iron-containing alcohol dehydrogenase [Sporobacter termitidis]SHH98162.1 Alcohol dehydrogenase, class IV [Sporobacter termitidis DSM 10068]